MAVPCHCNISKVKFDNVRCVGLAQGAMNDMLVEENEFTNCEQSSAKCAYDAEYGWNMMQDITFRGLNFYDNPNNKFLICADHNFIIEYIKVGKLYFWNKTNSYVVRNSDNITNTSLVHGDRKRSGYVRFSNNTINGNITIGAAKENDNWSLVVKDCDIIGRAENTINTGLYLRCRLNGSEADSSSVWNTSLGNGNFTACNISNKNGANMGGVYKNCTFENISGNMHGTFAVTNSIIENWNCYAGQYEPSYTFKNCEMNNFEITFGYWHEGADVLIDNCNINNKAYLLKLPHYSLKKSINIVNNNFTSKGTDGMIVFYDDRTGGSAGELVKQEMISIKNNTLKLDNSTYVVNGLSKDTVNNINITVKDNKLLSDNLLLYDKNCLESKNIKIEDK